MKDARAKPHPSIATAALPRHNGRRRLASFLGIDTERGGRFTVWPYIGSTGVVALALACGFLVESYIGLQSVLLVFLMAILASAIAWGLLASLLACVLSVMAFNFFLLPPIYTFTIADPQNALALFFFFIVAIIVSHLTAATRSHIAGAEAHAKTTAALYAFSRKLAGIGALQDLLATTTEQVSGMLDAPTVILLPDKVNGQLCVAGTHPSHDQLDDQGLAEAYSCWNHGNETGRVSSDQPQVGRIFRPLRTGDGLVGIIGIDCSDREAPLTADERELFNALADQAAIAIERASMASVLAESRILAETERFRGALLTSISHDLRTPLASILGAVSSLRTYADRHSVNERSELLATLQDEAERLSRFVANLLDMTRLESGAVELRLDFFDLSDIVGAALRRAGDILALHRIEVTIAPDLPMLRVDAILFEQVLFNLFDNAAKYAPPASRIDLTARRERNSACIEIVDEGPGIPPGDLEHIFDKFYRVHAQDRRRAGTGLGLAICRGFVEAQGGRIDAHNREDRSGAVLAICFPIPHSDELRQPVSAGG